MSNLEKLIICALFAIFIFLAFPLVIKGMETEQDMRQKQVQELFNKE